MEGGEEKKETERGRKKERETDRQTRKGEIVILNLRSASQANTKRNGNQQKRVLHLILSISVYQPLRDQIQ